MHVLLIDLHVLLAFHVNALFTGLSLVFILLKHICKCINRKHIFHISHKCYVFNIIPCWQILGCISKRPIFIFIFTFFFSIASEDSMLYDMCLNALLRTPSIDAFFSVSCLHWLSTDMALFADIFLFEILTATSVSAIQTNL